MWSHVSQSVRLWPSLNAAGHIFFKFDMGGLVLNYIIKYRITLPLHSAPTVVLWLLHLLHQSSCLEVVNGTFNSTAEKSGKDVILHFLFCSHSWRTSKIMSSIFWDITPCSPLKVNRRFERTCRLLYACFLLGLFFGPKDGGEKIIRNVGWIWTIWRYNTETRHLHKHRC
jgi:hypothetical protein